LRTVKFQNLWNILWDPDKPKYNVFSKVLWKYFLKLFFGKITFKLQNSFWAFGNILLQEYIGLRSYGKVLHSFKTVCKLEKIVFTHKVYFLKAQTFLFLIKSIIHGLFKKNCKNIFWSSVFTKKCELQLRKEKPSLCVWGWELSILAY